jgi:hypothetical protein
MLKGYKAIMDKLSEVWKTPIGLSSVMRWAQQGKDPIPIRRINPSGGKRPIVLADPSEVEAWAKRQVQTTAAAA